MRKANAIKRSAAEDKGSDAPLRSHTGTRKDDDSLRLANGLVKEWIGRAHLVFRWSGSLP
jgi:hypothetical protein